MSGAAGDDEEAGAAPGMDLPFGGEVGLGVASQAYWWHNKYAPRKPKYFNRWVFVGRAARGRAAPRAPAPRAPAPPRSCATLSRAAALRRRLAVASRRTSPPTACPAELESSPPTRPPLA
jgi:hypothetical protein